MSRHQTSYPISAVSYEYPIVEIGKCTLDLPGFEPTAEVVKDMTKSSNNRVRKMGIKASIRNSKLKLPDGRACSVSPSFVTSFLTEGKCGSNVFNLYTPQEVFGRLGERLNNSKRSDRFRVALEKVKLGDGSEKVTARSIRPTSRFSPDFDLVSELVSGLDSPIDLNYCNGNVEFSMRNFRANSVKIADGDGEWQPRTFLSLPVDNFGHGYSFVEMLRLVCTNGAIGLSKGFRSEINLGSILKDKELTYDQRRARALYTLQSYINTMNNDEDASAMAERLRTATKSHLSLREYLLLFSVLARSLGHDAAQGPSVLTDMAGVIEKGGPTNVSEQARENYKKDYLLLRRFNSLAHTGNPDSSLETGDGKLWRIMLSEAGISARKASTVPTSATVYEGLNVITEAASHHLTINNSGQRRKLHGLVGTVLASPTGFDLENSKDVMPEGGLRALMVELNAGSVKERVAAGNV